MDDTTVLIEQLQAGKTELRDVLVEKNLGLVQHVVKRYVGRGVDAEDLFQIGSIGLIKAIDKFDLSYEVKFSTYAVPLICGEIKRFLRDDGIVKVSRSLKENHLHIRRATEHFTHEHGREPTMEEISEMTGLSKEDILLALESASEVESIYQSVYQSDGNELFLVDQVVAGGVQKGIGQTFGNGEDTEKDEVLNHILIKQMMGTLSEMERKLIEMRYFEDKTQTEIAKICGISQVQVSRLEKKILLKLRNDMKET
jgi:RNA polymerase sporulation-specific sigma factor